MARKLTFMAIVAPRDPAMSSTLRKYLVKRASDDFGPLARKLLNPEFLLSRAYPVCSIWRKERKS